MIIRYNLKVVGCDVAIAMGNIVDLFVFRLIKDPGMRAAVHRAGSQCMPRHQCGDLHKHQLIIGDTCSHCKDNRAMPGDFWIKGILKSTSLISICQKGGALLPILSNKSRGGRD